MSTPDEHLSAWTAACKVQPTDTFIGSFNVSARGRLSTVIRARNAASAKAEGNDNTLWVTAESSFSATSTRWTRGNTQPVISIEYDVRELWHLYYVASMNTDHRRPEMDRLITQVLFARELGVLQRRGEGGEVIEVAMTSDGRIYTDLPFLVSDLTGYWVDDHAKMSGIERQNYSAFLAKLCSVGVLADRLSGIALVVFRDALETSRPVSRSGKENKEEKADLSVSDLLRSLDMWLYLAGDKLISLSEREVNNFPPEIGKLGELAEKAQVPRQGGFSLQRWIFWVRRFDALRAEAAETDAELSEALFNSMNGMKTMASRIDSLLGRELKRQELSEYKIYHISEMKEKGWI